MNYQSVGGRFVLHEQSGGFGCPGDQPPADADDGDELC